MSWVNSKTGALHHDHQDETCTVFEKKIELFFRDTFKVELYIDHPVVPSRGVVWGTGEKPVLLMQKKPSQVLYKFIIHPI